MFTCSKRILRAALLVFAGLSLFSLSVQASDPVNCASFKTTTTGWVSNIQVTNNCSQSLDFKNTRITYTGDFIEGAIWGSFPSGMSYLQFVRDGSDLVFNLDPANAQWQKTLLAPGQSLTISYNANQAASNVKLFLSGNPTPPPVNEKGSIEASFVIVSVDGMTAPVLTVTGPSYPSGKTFTYDWSQPSLKVADLAYGQYTITASNVKGRDGALYVSKVTPSSVNIQSKTAQKITVSYTLAPSGSISLSVGQAPVAGMPVPQISIKNTTTNEEVQNLPTFNWGKSVKIQNLLADNQYTITANQMSYNNVTYKPTVNPAQVTVTYGGLTPVSVQYQADAPPVVKKGTVAVTVKGSPMSGSTNVTFTNTQDHSTSTQLVDLQKATNVQLPVGSYTISASGFDYSGKTYVVQKYEPSTVIVAENQSAPLVITFVAATPSTGSHFVTYLGTWGNIQQYNYAALDPKVDVINLAFFNIAKSGNTYTITDVDGALQKPTDLYWAPPIYGVWTNLKYSRPNTKVMLSFGGATYGSLWNSTLTAQNADAIAKMLADYVNNTTFPVYKSGSGSLESRLLGYVSVDGIDLDVEGGDGARLNTTVANNVVLLSQSLRKYLKSGKLLTFTGFSVGADPENACTVPGSVHCGEDIPILTQASTLYDWVNVMAYDAGIEYSQTEYKTAMANYATYLSKDKILLGLDMANQWPGFAEPASQLADKAAWQKQNGYGGVMFWAIVSESSQHGDPIQYLNTIANSLK